MVRSPAAEIGQTDINIVFDIDYTIVQPATDPLDPDVIKIDDELYKVNSWTRDIIESLSRHHNVRIYFFSGGKKERNEKLLKKIKTNSGRSLHEFTQDIFSYDDLHQVAEEGSFSQRLKKNLIPLGLNLDRTILIDDNANFAFKGQERNMLWLGKTYHHYEDFNKSFRDLGNTKVLQEYIPTSFQQWFVARNKLKFVYELLDDAIVNEQLGRVDFLDYISTNREDYIPYGEKFSDHYRKVYLEELPDKNMNCLRAIQSF